MKRILAALFALVMVFSVCLCFSACDKFYDHSDREGTTEKPKGSEKVDAFGYEYDTFVDDTSADDASAELITVYLPVALKDSVSTITFTRDQNGNITEIVRDGVTELTLTYDENNRCIEENSSYHLYYVKYTYDEKGNLVQHTESGSRDSIEETYVYDDHGNPIEHDNMVNGTHFYNTYENFYDANGSLTKVIAKRYRDGEFDYSRIYSYTSQELLVEVLTVDSQGAETARSIYEYNDQGLLEEIITYSQGAETARSIYEYNDQGLLIKQSYLQNVDGTGEYIKEEEFAWAYDANGNITERSFDIELIGNRRRTYTYDNDNLVSFADANGNITQVTCIKMRLTKQDAQRLKEQLDSYYSQLGYWPGFY